MEVAEPPGLERVTVHYQQQQDGSVLVRAVDALTFLREHPLLIGARLNLVRTQVRDTESAPYLVVTPTTGVAPRPRTGGSRKRRVDDRKQLTPLGLEAAQRDKRPVKGGLTKDSILWRLVYECCGGAGCTPRPGRSTGCELEVHCTATADQILNGDYVRVRLIKQHCADGSWVPPQPGPDPAKQAELTQALQAVQELRVEKGVCEARIARGGAMSAGAAAGAAAAAQTTRGNVAAWRHDFESRKRSAGRWGQGQAHQYRCCARWPQEPHLCCCREGVGCAIGVSWKAVAGNGRASLGGGEGRD